MVLVIHGFGLRPPLRSAAGMPAEPAVGAKGAAVAFPAACIVSSLHRAAAAETAACAKPRHVAATMGPMLASSTSSILYIYIYIYS